MRIATACIAVAVMGVAMLVAPAPAMAEDEEKIDWDTLRGRAVGYYRVGKKQLAAKELEAVRATEGGSKDARTHYWLAKTYYDLLILEKAFPIAKKAAELAAAAPDGPGTREKALFEEIDGFYGGVTLQPSKRSRTKTGYIYLEDVGGLINMKKKEVFASIAKRLESSTSEFPITIYLPFGKYTANEVPFATKRGETAEITVVVDAADKKEEGTNWVVIGGIAVGAAAAVGLTAVLLSGEEAKHEIRLGGTGL